jgi:hypothetical protein
MYDWGVAPGKDPLSREAKLIQIDDLFGYSYSSKG